MTVPFYLGAQGVRKSGEKVRIHLADPFSSQKLFALHPTMPGLICLLPGSTRRSVLDSDEARQCASWLKSLLDLSCGKRLIDDGI